MIDHERLIDTVRQTKEEQVRRGREIGGEEGQEEMTRPLVASIVIFRDHSAWGMFPLAGEQWMQDVYALITASGSDPVIHIAEQEDIHSDARRIEIGIYGTEEGEHVVHVPFDVVGGEVVWGEVEYDDDEPLFMGRLIRSAWATHHQAIMQEPKVGDFPDALFAVLPMTKVRTMVLFTDDLGGKLGEVAPEMFN